ncbi:MAG: amidohydrolase [Syntrophomonadaceae bacterium]|jgi:imidazolonepropionase-like amidohydrolase
MIAFKGGKVFSMGEKGEINGGTIIIEGNLIQAVGKDLEIPEGCQVIDTTGKYITPGFIDAHTHIGLEEEIYRIEGDDVNEINEPLTPHLMAVDGVNFRDLAFMDALRGGVTRSLCMPGSANILGGQAVFLKHLINQQQDMVYKNPWGLKAALGENPKRVYASEKKSPRTRMASASLLREAFYVAARLADKKDPKAREIFKYEPVIKVLRKEMPLLLHAHRADDILTALRIKDEYGFDLIIQHGTEAVLVADLLLQKNVPVFLGPLLVNRAKVEMKEVSFKNANLLHEAGVKFAFITDHPVIPIRYLRVCAALSISAGLDEKAAMEALTSVPAALLNVDKELGSLEKGKLADLVIFDGHPFDFRAKVEKVVVDGQIINVEE